MKKVIVIGGGFAGSTIARELQNDFEVTLIDNKDYFEFTPGILRTIVEPDHIKKLQIMHNHYLTSARFLRGEVEAVEKNKVIVGGRDIRYDYLVICSGSGYNIPIKEKDVVPAVRAEHLRKHHERLCKAKKVLIIGGGLVGIELAAEICTHYKDKSIILIHSHERLCERNKISTSRYAENFLLKKGVKLVFGEKVRKNHGNTFISDKGKEYKADIAFLCTGIKPNFEFMKKNLKRKLNEKNQIKVNEYMQVSGEKNIFAPGDVNDMKVEKTAQNAERQAKIVARNILSMERKEKLHKYIFRKTPMVISLGKWKGIFELDGIVFTGILPGILKSFIEWKEMKKLR